VLKKYRCLESDKSVLKNVAQDGSPR